MRHQTPSFNRDLIDEVFKVKEFAFDAVRLKDLLKERLDDAGVRVVTAAEALRVLPGDGFTAGGRPKGAWNFWPVCSVR